MSSYTRLNAASCAVLILVAAMMPRMQAHAQTTTADQTDNRIAVAMAGYNRFPISHSPEDLRKTAFDLITVIDQRALRTGDVVGHRRSIVAAYAKVLKLVDSLRDPNFVPNQPPSTCVTPPREPSGRQAPPCAAPQDVLDAGTRAHYLAAIDQRSAEIRYYNAQTQLVGIANDTVSLLGIVLHRFHTRAPDDSAALDDVLRKSSLDVARRDQIHVMY
jgi:hypothetical protein